MSSKKTSEDKLRKLYPSVNFAWTGRPKYKFSIAILEGGLHYDPMAGGTSLLIIALVLTLGPAFAAYSFGLNQLMIFFCFTAVVAIFLPDVSIELRRRNTAYAFDDKNLYFYIFNRGNPMCHTVSIKDVGRVTWVEYKKGNGVLHFFTKEKPEFKTRDFESGSSRPNLTFEDIDNVREVHGQLEELILN